MGPGAIWHDQHFALLGLGRADTGSANAAAPEANACGIFVERRIE